MSEPRAEQAERIVLGSLMMDRTVGDAVWAVMSVSDFYDPRNQMIAGVARQRHAEGLPTDPESMLRALLALNPPKKADLGPFLASCFGSVAVTGQAGYYAEVIRSCADRRALIREGERLIQSAENPACESGTVARESAAVLADMAEADMMLTRDAHVTSLREFLEGEDDTPDWVVPGLLAREDRLMLTGAEGLGKMMLLRQIAVMAAAGLHPFTGEKVAPCRVLMVDMENPRNIMRKTLRRMTFFARQQGMAGFDERMFVERRPGGLDLMRSENLGWLMRTVADCAPDLLVLGPLYKLIVGDPNEERPARLLSDALDSVRVRGGCALIVEAHSGHGSGDTPSQRPVRPIGSSVWRRWVEFGYGLRLADLEYAEEQRLVDFVSWKGDRDERDWPKQLMAGTTWPWRVV